jgi:hypothetical protein
MKFVTGVVLGIALSVGASGLLAQREFHPRLAKAIEAMLYGGGPARFRRSQSGSHPRHRRSHQAVGTGASVPAPVRVWLG